MAKDGLRGTGFYDTKQWHSVRDAIKRRDHMRCQACGALITGRYIVDHIKPVTLATRNDWNIAYNPDNLQLLCQACHNAKTNQTGAKNNIARFNHW